MKLFDCGVKDLPNLKASQTNLLIDLTDKETKGTWNVWRLGRQSIPESLSWTVNLTAKHLQRTHCIQMANISSVLATKADAADTFKVNAGWQNQQLRLRHQPAEVNTHGCVEDLIVANRGAQVPADVKGQAFITCCRVTLDCSENKQAGALD